MKKKFLLMVAMVAMLICALAISASAATIYKTADGTTLFSYVDDNGDFDFDSYEGSFPKEDENGNALTWYITATATEGADTVHTVASLKTLGEAGSINANGAYSFISPVTNKNTVSINFPDNAGIKTWAFGSFGGHNTRTSNNILFVYCPNTLTDLGFNPFQEAPVIVVDIEFEAPITQIQQNFAHEARNLEEINIPTTVTVINGNGSNNGAAFYNNKSLRSVNFTSNSALEKIGNSVFLDCDSLAKITLPNSVKTIDARAFQSCDKLVEIRFGASFENTTNISVCYQSFALRYVYLPKTVKALNEHTFGTAQGGMGGSNMVFFYTGSLTELEAFRGSLSANNQRLAGATAIEWNAELGDQYYKELATTENKCYVVYGYNTCDAFYGGVHVLDEAQSNACAGVCKNCGELSLAANPVHAFTTTIKYEGGFDVVGVKYELCSNEGCEYCETAKETEVPAILSGYKGFSVPENASYKGITFGYDIDKTALSEYEAVNAKLEMGFVVAVNDQLNGSKPLDEGVTAKVINAKFTDGQGAFNRVDFVLKGDIWDEQIDTDADGVKDTYVKDVKFFMCAYVIENGEVSYVNEAVADYATYAPVAE